MKTELHKKVADKMIEKFKEIEGVETLRADIEKWYEGFEPQASRVIIYYVLESLVLKGFLFKSPLVMFDAYKIGEFRYYLSSTGWDYENYDKVLVEEKRKRDLEDALLSSSVASNTWSPRWALLAAFFAGLSFIVSVYTINRSEKLSPSLLQIGTTLSNQKENIGNIQSSLKEISSSIQKLKTDSISVRLKK